MLIFNYNLILIFPFTVVQKSDFPKNFYIVDLQTNHTDYCDVIYLELRKNACNFIGYCKNILRVYDVYSIASYYDLKITSIAAKNSD